MPSRETVPTTPRNKIRQIRTRIKRSFRGRPASAGRERAEAVYCTRATFFVAAVTANLPPGGVHHGVEHARRPGQSETGGLGPPPRGGAVSAAPPSSWRE
jgi:hypothetical protein